MSAAAMPRPLRLGTRASRLAVRQSNGIACALRELGADVELVTITTAGDLRPPDTAWGEGAFVGTLEAALLDGRVDLAVHSAKDVPTTIDARLRIAAYPAREDPRDAMVCREPGLTLDTLPPGTRVGTDSPRRTAFLLARRPDLAVHPLHGNVDTRLARLDAGATDVLVLAVAGLARLGLADRVDEVLDSCVVPPAAGQGSLAVQVRVDDPIPRGWAEQLDDPATRAAVETERAFLMANGGGCRAPIGCLARAEPEGIELIGARVADPATPLDGLTPGTPPRVAWGTAWGPVGRGLDLATNLADELRARLQRDPTATIDPRSTGRAGFAAAEALGTFR